MSVRDDHDRFGLGRDRVAVFDADRRTLLGHVAPNATSVAATRLSQGRPCRFENVRGRWAWVAERKGGAS